MTEKWCGLCKRRHYVQAQQPEPLSLRPSLAEVLSIALVFGAYFMAMAWVWANV